MFILMRQTILLKTSITQFIELLKWNQVITSNFYAEYHEDSNEKDPKFKIGDHVRILKYKNVFAKVYTSNWSEEIFVIRKK